MTTRAELIEGLHCNALWRSPDTSDLLKQAADMLEADAVAPAQPFLPDWVNYRQGKEDGKAEAQQPLTCTWTPEDDDNMPGTWASSCGELWSFIDGGPAENRVTYCHHCGGKVLIGTKP
jgi:hypothetical protein